MHQSLKHYFLAKKTSVKDVVLERSRLSFRLIVTIDKLLTIVTNHRERSTSHQTHWSKLKASLLTPFIFGFERSCMHVEFATPSSSRDWHVHREDRDTPEDRFTNGRYSTTTITVCPPSGLSPAIRNLSYLLSNATSSVTDRVNKSRRKIHRTHSSPAAQLFFFSQRTFLCSFSTFGV